MGSGEGGKIVGDYAASDRIQDEKVRAGGKKLIKKELPHIVPGYVSYSFFFLGILSAIAFRIIIIFQRLAPAWVRPVWYIGVVGYIGFFMYRYIIARKRKNAIGDFKLIEKIKADACLLDEEKEVTAYLLSSLKKSHEDVNYLIIFILSIVAILIDLALSLYK